MMSNLCRVNYKQLFELSATFLPKPVCLLCHQSLMRFARICDDCFLELPWVDESIILPGLDNICVALDYIAPVDRLVLGGKFSNRLDNLSLLAELFIDYWRRHQFGLPEVLIPVPLHAERLRERGYNQALELAKIIGRKLQVPVDFDCVERIKSTKAQAGLSAKMRGGNIRDAFGVNGLMNYSHVAIVDDVFTTGNTVRELSGILRAANVKQVDLYCIARTVLDF